MATFKIGRLVLKSLFKKPATLMYPVKSREWQERTRGHIEINVNDCILCGICQRKCPTNAIKVDRNEAYWEIQRMQCIQCSSCVDNCPKKCLINEPDYTEPGTEKVIDKIDVPKPAPKPKPAMDPETAKKVAEAKKKAAAAKAAKEAADSEAPKAEEKPEAEAKTEEKAD